MEYVTKPFNPVELAPIVRGLLDRVARGERDEFRHQKLAALRSLIEQA
jgi:DNA-binding response OmpR family regulator